MDKAADLTTLTEAGLEALFNHPGSDALITAVALELCARWNRSFPEKVLETCKKAFAFAERLEEKDSLAKLINNAGTACHRTGQFVQAMNYYMRALDINEKTGNITQQATNIGNIGVIYYEFGDYNEAVNYMIKGLELNRKSRNRRGEATNLGNIASMYIELENYVKAEEYILEEEKILTELDDTRGLTYNQINRANILILKKDYSAALNLLYGYLETCKKEGNKKNMATAAGNIGYIYSLQGEWDKARDYCNLSLQLDLELNLLKPAAIQYIHLAEFYANRKCSYYDTSIAEDYFLKAIDTTEQLGIKRQLYDAHFKLSNLYRDIERWQDSDEHFRKFHELEKEVKNDEMQKKASSYEMQHKLDLKDKEQEVTMRILHNILPKQIAERIKNGEEKIVEHFEQATVLFADIVGFTTWSKDKPIAEVATVLDNLFQIFDELTLQLGIEKIKTIGDAYMCVAGLPETCDDHAERIANMALAMQQKIKEHYPDGEIKLRIGIHTGEAIAGVIGKNKFAYDLWGDTVNTASRMESHGLPDKIQVTEDVMKLLSSKFSFEERGTIDVKGKGTMKTYWLTGVS
jgi:class 3 adenylate cyclase